MKILMRVFCATATAAAALLTGKATYHYHSTSKKFMDSVDDTISTLKEPKGKKWNFQAKITKVVQEKVNSNPTNIKVGATIDGGGVRGIVPLFILY